MDELLEIFRRILGPGGVEALAVLGVPAAASVANAASGGSAPGRSGAGQTIVNTMATVLGSGLGMVRVVKGLLNMFGGSSPESPAPLVRYALPTPIEMEAANPHGVLTGALDLVDYEEGGQARVAPRGGLAGAANITVQVQAMDSQSFLDHSQEIARAVREAMLNMHALNDVVSDF